MFKVDLNSDLGESFGAYKMGNDKEILQNVTSANVACGFHAGDPAVMRKTVKMAIEAGCAIGAHPGMQDLVGFGRRKMEITPDEAYEIVLYQVGALAAFVKPKAIAARQASRCFIQYGGQRCCWRKRLLLRFIDLTLHSCFLVWRAANLSRLARKLVLRLPVRFLLTEATRRTVH